MTDLFRKQVIEEQSSRLHGEVILLPKLSHSLILLFLVVWLVLSLYWAGTSTYTKKEEVKGWVEASGGVAYVYTRGGVLSEILVSDGAAVIKGQKLAIVKNGKMLSDGRQLGELLSREYTAQNMVLQNRIKRAERLYLQKKEHLVIQVEAVKTEISILDKQISSLDERYKIVSDQERLASGLYSKGHVSDIGLDEFKRARLSLLGEKQGFERVGVALQSRLSAMRYEQSLLESDYMEQADSFKLRLSDNSLESTRLEEQSEYALFASRNGVVTGIQAKLGQQVSPNVPVMSIISGSEKMLASLLIPARAAAFIEVGQTVDIRYDSFAYEKFGIHKGVVVAISQTILLPGEIINASQVVDEPVYRLTAELESPYVRAYGKDHLLKAGMTLMADIRVDEGRSLLEWLFEPIYSIHGRL